MFEVLSLSLFAQHLRSSLTTLVTSVYSRSLPFVPGCHPVCVSPLSVGARFRVGSRDGTRHPPSRRVATTVRQGKGVKNRTERVPQDTVFSGLYASFPSWLQNPHFTVQRTTSMTRVNPNLTRNLTVPLTYFIVTYPGRVIRGVLPHQRQGNGRSTTRTWSRWHFGWSGPPSEPKRVKTGRVSGPRLFYTWLDWDPTTHPRGPDRWWLPKDTVTFSDYDDSTVRDWRVLWGSRQTGSSHPADRHHSVRTTVSGLHRTSVDQHLPIRTREDREEEGWRGNVAREVDVGKTS